MYVCIYVCIHTHKHTCRHVYIHTNYIYIHVYVICIYMFSNENRRNFLKDKNSKPAYPHLLFKFLFLLIFIICHHTYFCIYVTECNFYCYVCRPEVKMVIVKSMGKLYQQVLLSLGWQ